ncbi:MAG: ATP synthase F0F1 subunit B' [Candidatus Synechococcus spongiarum 15L]|uniref:ATP synthase subunit b' n=2 Tax=Candidatus Synechococcus spongiarum TaxID=431041 RepID=A0A1T1CRE3_9SYNE|nr:F0F1 ATP synthase subunit B' [Candidatus Synechococcus spongiarum]KKZ13969.1 MAG: ATP synthase F0F1 subunit B' [Candidatus Synechococcus spongiarum 15L]OOV31179.1 F0F1 ATP synthase subunit B' [Candidatus Synechococcus spongiarum LMB bulk15N]
MSWFPLAEAPVPEGGLFDFDATLPLMAVQVVILTFILNKLFFQPVGKVVEEREGFVTTSHKDAKERLARVQRLEQDLKARLQQARHDAQAVVAAAEDEVATLHKAALAEAKASATKLREQARAEIDAQRSEADAVLAKESRQIADLIIRRLVTF